MEGPVIPDYNYRYENGKHIYNFHIPQGSHNLSKIHVSGCSKNTQIQLSSYEYIIQRWNTKEEKSLNIDSIFVDEIGDRYSLWMWACPYSFFDLSLISEEKLENPFVRLIFEKIPEHYQQMYKGDSKIIRLNPEKTIIYVFGNCIGVEYNV